MSLPVLLVMAAITYASRALALVLMPSPPRGVERFLNRIPAPLFAGLAALSLIDDSGDLAAPEVLIATAGALAASATRSLLYVLLGGLAGYALGTAIL
jgi:branched-subunit amino acid transport protein